MTMGRVPRCEEVYCMMVLGNRSLSFACLHVKQIQGLLKRFGLPLCGVGPRSPPISSGGVAVGASSAGGAHGGQDVVGDAETWQRRERLAGGCFCMVVVLREYRECCEISRSVGRTTAI